MALAHNLGFPRISDDRELRARHWQAQKEAGIELLPVGDTAWYYQHPGVVDAQASVLAGHLEPLFQEVTEAIALGHAVKPVLVGPLTLLWQGEENGLDTLERLDSLLPEYDQALNQLAVLGVEWVQIDEPILALELPQAWKNAYERVYNILQRAPLKKLIATCSGALGGNLGLAANLPVDGLHIDLVQAPEQYLSVLDRLPAYKVLSLGLVDGRQASPGDLAQLQDVLRDAHDRLGERLWLAPSCSLLDNPLEQAVHKCRQVGALVHAVNTSHTPTPR